MSETETPITIEQSVTEKQQTPEPASHQASVTPVAMSPATSLNLADEVKTDGGRKKSNPNLSNSTKKKKKKKMLVAAQAMGSLKKITPYTRFETPLYILPMTVAERKKVRDEKRLIMHMGLGLGQKVQLKRGVMKGMIKFIGEVHFTYGILIGCEMAGNANGKHSGEMDKIKYFDCKRNGGLFVRVEAIDKILDANSKKKFKLSKKWKECDETTLHRFQLLMQEMADGADDDEVGEIDVSGLNKKEKARLDRLHLEIGDVVEVDKGRKGILHFCGPVHWSENIMFGIEYIDKAVGKYDGSYGDKRYFSCPEKRGMFFTSDKIRKKATLPGMMEW